MEKMRAFFLGGKQKREDGQHALEGFKEKRKNKRQAKGSDLERKKRLEDFWEKHRGSRK